MPYRVMKARALPFLVLAAAMLAAMSAVVPAFGTSDRRAPRSASDNVPPSLHSPPVADSVVDRYLVDPRGEVEGLLLRDGSQMHVTSRDAKQLTAMVQPGDRVQVHGRRKGHTPLIQPDVIKNMSDGTSYTIPSRLDLPITPEEQLTVNQLRGGGRIEALLYDYLEGTIHGMLLSDGTQVRLPADANEKLRQSLRVNDEVTVEGYGTQTPYGLALEATSIGLKGHRMTPLDPAVETLDR